MLEKTRQQVQSTELSVKVFDQWVRRRQARPALRIPESKKDLQELGLANFKSQLAEPRRDHLRQLRELGPKLSTADKVALLVSLELPAVEISTILHKMSAQLARDPDAPYFSKTNQGDNCGVGCGCGCHAMDDLPYDERIAEHLRAKPYSIDPFNESGIPEQDRDGLLIRDFIASYEELSDAVSKQVNQRYFVMGKSF